MSLGGLRRPTELSMRGFDRANYRVDESDLANAGLKKCFDSCKHEFHRYDRFDRYQYIAWRLGRDPEKIGIPCKQFQGATLRVTITPPASDGFVARVLYEIRGDRVIVWSVTPTQGVAVM